MNFPSLNKKKKKSKNEVSLRNIMDNIKCSNIHITGVLEGKEREKDRKSVLSEDTMTENFPKLVKEIDI